MVREKNNLYEKGMMIKMKKFIERYATKKAIQMVLVVVVLMVVSFGVGKAFSTESKSTKLRFGDLGELVTQVAYCTEVSLTDVNRDIFGLGIPFTNSKYIFSYDVVIKAGFDFEQIKYQEKNDKIQVILPDPYIISAEVDENSYKIFHEQESIFRKISLSELAIARQELKQQAIKDAIDNGLYDNAKANAEMLLTAFFAQGYDLNEYTIEFVY